MEIFKWSNFSNGEYSNRDSYWKTYQMLDTFENLVLKLYENTTYDKKYLTKRVME